MATKKWSLAASLAWGALSLVAASWLWCSPAGAQIKDYYYDQDRGDYIMRPEPLVQKYLSHQEVVKKAQAGDEESQYQLGRDYLEGVVVPQSFERARYWFYRAARQGNHEAQFALGDMLDTTEYGMLDKVQAYFWYSLAYAGGVAQAVNRRLHLADRMSQEEIRRAQDLQAGWMAVKEKTGPAAPAKP
ncbi:MAG: hypothetical protein AB1814_02860 [Thermodesulfobacteriota bacterium]